MDRTTIKQAGELIKIGYSYHDEEKLYNEGYKGNVHGAVLAMQRIFANVMNVRMYNLSNAVVNYYDNIDLTPSMTLSEMRSYMHETSILMLRDGRGLDEDIDQHELEFAIGYTIFEETGEEEYGKED